MKKNYYLLRELSKLFAGLIVADIIIGFWVLLHGIYAFPFIGIASVPPPLYVWMTSDFILFIFLIHYGWRLSLPIKHSQKTFFTIAGCIFLILATLHLLRLVSGVTVISGFSAIYGLNVLGLIAIIFLAYTTLVFAFYSEK